MVQIFRTNSNNEDFIELVKQLDAYLAIIDGDDHAYYQQFNKTAAMKQVLVGYENETPVACGAIRVYDDYSMEVKRMFVEPLSRGQGISKLILKTLEEWAMELGYKRCILETHERQKEAVSLYKSSGYTIIPNYGQYAKMEHSVCFEKLLYV